MSGIDIAILIAVAAGIGYVIYRKKKKSDNNSGGSGGGGKPDDPGKPKQKRK